MECMALASRRIGLLRLGHYDHAATIAVVNYRPRNCGVFDAACNDRTGLQLQHAFEFPDYDMFIPASLALKRVEFHDV